MLTASECRMYPNQKQESQAVKTFGSCRYIYNLFLVVWNTVYQYTGSGMSYYSCSASLTELKKVLPWLKEADSTALQSALRDLSDTFSAFFRKNADHPVFHRKGFNDSYTSKNNSHSIRILDKNHILIPKLGRVKVRGLRILDGKIISATVSREPTGKWFVSLLYETEDPKPLEPTGKSVGCDLGLKDFLILSDGTRIANPGFGSKLADKLAKEQRKLSKKIEDNIDHYEERNGRRYPVYKRPLRECSNIQKQRKKIAKIHEKIRNCRLDFEHKLSADLIKNHDVIILEDLNVKGMVKDHKLARMICDASWGEFVTMLRYKAVRTGRTVQLIDRFFPSSQMCSDCGHVSPITKDLKVREWDCPVCGAHHDRDLNSAVNIRREGLRILSAC